MTKLAELLAQNPIFSVLDKSTQAALCRSASARQYQKDDWVAHNGDIWPYLFIIESGRISAVKESLEGRSLQVAQFGPGEVFWGLAFFLPDSPTPAALVASEASRLHLWPAETVLPVLLENGEMSWELTRLMVQRMLRASDIVEGLAFQPVVGRLAGWLLGRAQDTAGEPIERDMTLDDIAAQIGSTREMVCRALYRFADEGAVTIDRTEFNISDAGKLENYLAKGKS